MSTKPYYTLLLWLLVAVIGLFARVKAEDIVYVTTTVDASTIVAASPTAPSPASYTSFDDFKKTVLQVSNDYRQSHDAKPLVWNEALTEYALNWAKACVWKHSHGPYGENLAYGYPNATAAIDAWGDEGKLYDFHKPTGFTEKTGHFTQLVWKSTAEVGCAAVNCGYTYDKARADNEDDPLLDARAEDSAPRAQGWYVVCEYTPAGNVVGEHDKYFRKNVVPKESSTSSTHPSGGSTMTSEKSFSLRLTLLALGTIAVGMSLYT
ncbi:hypothetical protein N7448_007165 [Penicillium atrosanguineum]|uniref:SCP domain-containing protein n=1 Tax=Penicillium atrosanguineum TaxID=1132637 RepID=A0A9W9L3S3_9EURO|nr:uncharacterized protein N7443_010929 [Penicillium atrosanguineum]KAJ5133007.1 hypothetical protein N7448_007165 [Penicillium atrosanguineum]KAJ5141100.1 hypothetical protein N7526_002095 [Penicillium atrosanguineum]KAJ5290676.1 hypothetical protein N7443_010929 [Penicillium atrosanguineum]KAJ5308499.1 hypothetical protein N7476_009155 [Penicillium atrosanguineum]